MGWHPAAGVFAAVFGIYLKPTYFKYVDNKEEDITKLL
jgi:hypothetical protein